MSGGTLIKAPVSFQSQKKSNGAPNGFYGEIDWDRYVSKSLDLDQSHYKMNKTTFFSAEADLFSFC